MICFRCNNESEFEIQEVNIEQVYNNIIVKVNSPVTVCKQCGWQFLVNGQLNELKIRVKYGSILKYELIESNTDYITGY